ncbi:MAG: hypothetical protein WCT47_20695 [Betaproteobacteria bacterium]
MRQTRGFQILMRPVQLKQQGVMLLPQFKRSGLKSLTGAKRFLFTQATGLMERPLRVSSRVRCILLSLRLRTQGFIANLRERFARLQEFAFQRLMPALPCLSLTSSGLQLFMRLVQLQQQLVTLLAHLQQSRFIRLMRGLQLGPDDLQLSFMVGQQARQFMAALLAQCPHPLFVLLQQAFQAGFVLVGRLLGSRLLV